SSSQYPQYPAKAYIWNNDAVWYWPSYRDSCCASYSIYASPLPELKMLHGSQVENFSLKTQAAYWHKRNDHGYNLNGSCERPGNPNILHRSDMRRNIALGNQHHYNNVC